MPFETRTISMLCFILTFIGACKPNIKLKTADLDLQKELVWPSQKSAKESDSYVIDPKVYKMLKKKLSKISNPIVRYSKEAVFDIVSADATGKKTLKKSGVGLSIKVTRFSSEMTLSIHRLKKEPGNGTIFQNELYICELNDHTLGLEILKRGRSIAELSDHDCRVQYGSQNVGLFGRLKNELNDIASIEKLSTVVLYAGLGPIMNSDSELVSGLTEVAGQIENLELTKTRYGRKLTLIEIRKLHNGSIKTRDNNKLERFLSGLGIPVVPVHYSRSELIYVLAEKSGKDLDRISGLRFVNGL